MERKRSGITGTCQESRRDHRCSRVESIPGVELDFAQHDAVYRRQRQYHVLVLRRLLQRRWTGVSAELNILFPLTQMPPNRLQYPPCHCKPSIEGKLAHAPRNGRKPNREKYGSHNRIQKKRTTYPRHLCLYVGRWRSILGTFGRSGLHSRFEFGRLSKVTNNTEVARKFVRLLPKTAERGRSYSLAPQSSRCRGIHLKLWEF